MLELSRGGIGGRDLAGAGGSPPRVEQDEDEGGRSGDEQEPHENAAEILPFQSRPVIQGRRDDILSTRGSDPPADPSPCSSR